MSEDYEYMDEDMAPTTDEGNMDPASARLADTLQGLAIQARPQQSTERLADTFEGLAIQKPR